MFIPYAVYDSGLLLRGGRGRAGAGRWEKTGEKNNTL